MNLVLLVYFTPDFCRVHEQIKIIISFHGLLHTLTVNSEAYQTNQIWNNLMAHSDAVASYHYHQKVLSLSLSPSFATMECPLKIA